MRDYELVVVINPEVTEENLPGTVEKIGRWVTEKGGAITQVDQWGKRKLAYPIKRCTEGNYVLTRFQAEPELAAELEANLETSEEVLRYLLVRVEG